MHISIIIPKGQYSVVNVAGAHHMLSAANGVNSQMTGNKLFDIDFVSSSCPAETSDGLFTIHHVKTIVEVKKTDLILIPAVHNDIEEVFNENSELINWIIKAYKNGTSIASFCIGVYFLAEAGILKDQPCSTHWNYVDDLKERYPNINVIPENIVTECDGIYTSGGAFAYTNLMVYLIERFGGRELAIRIAKSFMIDIGQASQSPFIIFSGQRKHANDTILKVQDHIESNFNQKFTTDELSTKFNLNRRSLERNFKKYTGNTINEYTQRVRTEAAKKEFEVGRKNINEVMYEVGYNDPKAFRDMFKRFAGISPAEYKRKYSAVY